jgi:hypothetical protein
VDGRDKPGHDESGGETAAVIASASAQRPSCPAHAAIQHVAAFRFISDVAEYWIVRWSLSSGAHSRDPVADDDGSEFDRRHNFAFSRHDTPELPETRSRKRKICKADWRRSRSQPLRLARWPDDGFGSNPPLELRPQRRLLFGHLQFGDKL